MRPRLSPPVLRRASTFIVVAGALLAGATAPAQAGLLNSTLANPLGTVLGTAATATGALGVNLLTSDCAASTTVQRFAAFDGDAAWYYPVAESRGVVVPAGGSFTTSPQCLGLTDAVARIVASGPVGSSLVIESVDASGLRLPVGRFAVGGGATSKPLPLIFNLTALLRQGRAANIAVRLTAVGGPVTVGDVWIDPFKKR